MLNDYKVIVVLALSMPESSKGHPVIAVWGNKLHAADRNQISDYLLNETNIGEQFRTGVTLDSSYLEPSSNKDRILKLELLAMPEETLGSELRSALPKLTEYFNKLALREGLTGKNQKIDVDIRFIEEDVFSRLFPNKAGFFSPLTRKIYVRYPQDLTPKSILRMYLTIIHELRHRIGKIRIEAIVDLTSSFDSERISIKNPATQLTKLHPSSWNQNERLFFEELFTIGWVSEHLSEVIPENVIASFRSYYAKPRGIDPSSVQLDKAMEDVNFWDVIHNDVQFVWDAMKEEIPNLEKLLIKARSGEKGNLVPLVQAIRVTFGKEALLVLTYTKFPATQHAMEILKAIFARRRTQKHYDDLLKQQNRINVNFWQKIARIATRRDSESITNSQNNSKMKLSLASEKEMLDSQTSTIRQLLNTYLSDKGYEGEPLR